MSTRRAPAAPPVDLIAVARHRAGIDPRHNLLVRIAVETLAGIPSLLVNVVAEYALAEVLQQEAINTARDRTIRQMHEADAGSLEKRNPTELKRRRDALDGTRPYQSPTLDRHMVVHRAGTLLAVGIANLRRRDRPAHAKDSQLFAALGLELVNRGLQFMHGEKREAYLLDAAECIYAWQSLKDEVNHRKSWIQDLLATDAKEFIKDDGVVMSAKEALVRFHLLHPTHTATIKSHRTFGNEYGPVLRAAESLAGTGF